MVIMLTKFCEIIFHGFTIIEPYLEPRKKTNLTILDCWSNDGTFDTETKIGSIKSITPNMEVSFELKIENMDSCDVVEYNRVFRIHYWFYFGIKKSTEASKFYIFHSGLGSCRYLHKQNSFNYTNNWQKKFL